MKEIRDNSNKSILVPDMPVMSPFTDEEAMSVVEDKIENMKFEDPFDFEQACELKATVRKNGSLPLTHQHLAHKLATQEEEPW